jgi:arginine deiminase
LAELPLAGITLTEQLSRDGAFALQPLGDQVFARDHSSWVHARQAVTGPAPGRARELLHLWAVFGHHALFGGVACPPPAAAPAVGGSDVLVASETCVLIGMTERTRTAPVERLAALLLRETPVQRVLAVLLPGRMRLDTLLAMVDRDTFLAHPTLKRRATVYRLWAPGEGIRADREPSLPAALTDALRAPVRWLSGGNEDLPTVAADVLTTAPGRVLSADRNARTNQALLAAGIEIETYPYAGLARGPHAMVSVLNRHSDEFAPTAETA